MDAVCIQKKLDYIKNNIQIINPDRGYIRVQFEYKTLDGFSVYLNKTSLFSGVVTLYEGKLIFKKTYSSMKYLGVHQIEIVNFNMNPFNKADLKRCWRASNDFLK